MSQQLFEHPSVIIKDKLYLGGLKQAHNEDLMKHYKFTHIVNVTTELVNKFEHLNIKYKNVEIDDDESEDLYSSFHDVFEFIENALKESEASKILIHCVGGISRSASLTISYLMIKNKCTLKESLLFVKERRECIYPNSGFFNQLLKLEMELLGKNSCDEEFYSQPNCWFDNLVFE